MVSAQVSYFLGRFENTANLSPDVLPFTHLHGSVFPFCCCISLPSNVYSWESACSLTSYTRRQTPQSIDFGFDLLCSPHWQALSSLWEALNAYSLNE